MRKKKKVNNGPQKPDSLLLLSLPALPLSPFLPLLRRAHWTSVDLLPNRSATLTSPPARLPLPPSSPPPVSLLFFSIFCLLRELHWCNIPRRDTCGLFIQEAAVAAAALNSRLSENQRPKTASNCPATLRRLPCQHCTARSGVYDRAINFWSVGPGASPPPLGTLGDAGFLSSLSQHSSSSRAELGYGSAVPPFSRHVRSTFFSLFFLHYRRRKATHSVALGNTTGFVWLCASPVEFATGALNRRQRH